MIAIRRALLQQKQRGWMPVWRSRASQGKPGIARAACLSVIERSEIASCASAGFPEKHRASGYQSQIDVRTSHRVPFSLGTFSWASKRKYLARKGRNLARDAPETGKSAATRGGNRKKHPSRQAKASKSCLRSAVWPRKHGYVQKHQRGKSDLPVRNSSTARAHCRPSRIAQTTSD